MQILQSNMETKITKERKTKKIETADLGFVLGNNHFDNDGSQNYLIFQPILNTFTKPTGAAETIKPWKSKGLSHEKH